jgi:hypothetical protein
MSTTTVKCTDLKYKFYNGGWSSWSSNLYGGYAGKEKYLAVLSFKTPKISTLHTKNKLHVTIPFVRQTTISKTGYLYVKLWASDPTTSSNLQIPTATNCNASYYWSVDDLEVHTSSFVLDDITLSSDTTFYLAIGANHTMEIGHKYDNAEDMFSIQWEYLSWTAIGVGSINFTDHYNNTFSFTVTKGADGTNNPAKGTTASWGYTSACANSGVATKKELTIATESDADRKVWAKVVTDATYGGDTTFSNSYKVKQYVAPKAPGVPAISSPTRLTTKGLWTFTWTAATAINTSSPVKGYRIRLYKNNTLIKGLVTNKDNNITLADGGTNEYLDSDSTSTTAIVDPTAFNFKAGDKVKLSISAYTRFGKANSGTRWLGKSPTVKTSTEYTVQNAGTVKVKVGGAWKEGQAYVKVNNAWKEADTVSIKVGNSWKDSK